MDANADAAQFVHAGEEIALVRPRFFSRPFDFDGQEIAEANAAFAGKVHLLRQDAEDVGHPPQSDEFTVAAACERDRAWFCRQANTPFRAR